MQRTHRAFTLIELLVVIAIIAILAAILFPVFAQAKLAAKKTSDLSNMKQIATGIAIYQNDSDDNFPRLIQGDFTNWPASTSLWSGAGVTQPYLKNFDIIKSPADSFKVTDNDALYGFPSTRKGRESSYLPNAISDFDDGGTSRTAWGVSHPQGLFTIPSDFTNSTSGAMSSTAVNSPSDVIMLANGDVEYYDKAYGCGAYLNNEVDYCYIFPGVYGDWIPGTIRLNLPDAFSQALGKAWRKYSGGANFAMSDTSAKFLKPDAVDVPKRWLANYSGN